MARILVIGSRKSHDSAEFQKACQAIGYALAMHRHTIVASAHGPDDAETWVLNGAAAARPAKRMRVVPFSPALPGVQDLLDENYIRSQWPTLDPQPPFRTKGAWAVGQAVALIRCDAALLIGGGALTENVAALSLELDKPYYAVPRLGGTAAIVATEDYAKHRSMKMPESLIAPLADDPDFGEKAVKATEFVMRRCRENAARRNNVLLLSLSLAVLAALLLVLFWKDPLGNEARLVYTTCMGAIAGAMFAFLVSRVVERRVATGSSLAGQGALACFLGVLYGLFALEAGEFYGVHVAAMAEVALDALAFKMAIVGVGVGALLGPASNKALEDVARAAQLKKGHEAN